MPICVYMITQYSVGINFSTYLSIVAVLIINISACDYEDKVHLHYSRIDNHVIVLWMTQWIWGIQYPFSISGYTFPHNSFDRAQQILIS